MENTTVKFQKYYVTNGVVKARVSYSLTHLNTGETCVTLYANDYSGDLSKVFPNGYQNNTDIMTDYFEKGKVRIMFGTPLYNAALSRVRSR